jgi:hypothetical protein
MSESKNLGNGSNYNKALLLIFGIAVTIFGGLVFALPIEVTGIIAHMDCRTDCVSTTPSYGSYNLRALIVLAVFACFGFLPFLG